MLFCSSAIYIVFWWTIPSHNAWQVTMLNQVQRSQEYMLRVNIAILWEFNMSEGKGKCKQIIWDLRKCLLQPGRTDKKKKKSEYMPWCDIWESDEKEWLLIYHKCVQFIYMGTVLWYTFILFKWMIQSPSQHACF